jgi:hypothetical protein
LSKGSSSKVEQLQKRPPFERALFACHTDRSLTIALSFEFSVDDGFNI